MSSPALSSISMARAHTYSWPWGIMVAVSDCHLPALSPSPPVHSHLSTPSGIDSRGTTATRCSQSILPLPWPGHIKQELLLFLSPNSPPCPLSQAHLKQENLITKAHGAELSTPSIHRAWDKHGNQGSTTHAKPAGLCKVFQDPCAHTVFMQVQAPLAPILRDYTYQIVQ